MTGQILSDLDGTIDLPAGKVYPPAQLFTSLTYFFVLSPPTPSKARFVRSTRAGHPEPRERPGHVLLRP